MPDACEIFHLSGELLISITMYKRISPSIKHGMHIMCNYKNDRKMVGLTGRRPASYFFFFVSVTNYKHGVISHLCGAEVRDKTCMAYTRVF